MKKLLFWILLISGTALILGSCAKKEESDAAASATETAGTGTTASGTISGIENLTGTFNMSFNGEEPSGGCISNSTAITALSSLLPSNTLAFKNQIIITSSTTWAQSMQYYSDASCATLTGYMNMGYKNASVGDSLSGLSAGSNPAKPTTAKKISYNNDFTALKSNTDTTTTFFNTLLGASTLSTLGFTQGTELNIDNTDEDQEVNIWETGTMSGSSKTYLFFGDAHSTNYPSDWTSADVWWQE